jgi:hypothetical protein
MNNKNNNYNGIKITSLKAIPTEEDMCVPTPLREPTKEKIEVTPFPVTEKYLGVKLIEAAEMDSAAFN